MKEIKYTLTQNAKKVGRTVYLGDTKIKADIVKEQSNLSKLMMDKHQLNQLWDELEKIDPLQKGMGWVDRLQIALLKHLAKPEFNLYRYQGADIYIPLSDYLKEGE